MTDCLLTYPVIRRRSLERALRVRTSYAAARRALPAARWFSTPRTCPHPGGATQGPRAQATPPVETQRQPAGGYPGKRPTQSSRHRVPGFSSYPEALIGTRAPASLPNATMPAMNNDIRIWWLHIDSYRVFHYVRPPANATGAITTPDGGPQRPGGTTWQERARKNF